MPAGWTYSPATVVGNPSNRTITWSTAAGTSDVAVSVRDVAGNESAVRTISLIRDATSPAATITSPVGSSAQVLEDVDVSWTTVEIGSGLALSSVQRQSAAADAIADCATATFSNDGVAVSSSSPMTQVGLSEATCYRWVVAVTDNVGLGSSAPSGTVFIDQERYAAAVGRDQPVGYWRLGESSGATAFDEAGNLDGAYQGAFTLGASGLLADDPNTSATFDGTSAYATTGAGNQLSLAVTGALTIEAWVKPTSAAAPGAIVSRGGAANGYDYWLAWDDGTIEITVWTPTGTERTTVATPADAVPAGEVSHLVVTLDDVADVVEIFVNGRSVVRATTAWIGTSSPQADDPLAIGRRDDVAAAYFDGLIDDVAIYDTVLRDVQILDHYLAASDPCAPGQPGVTYGTSAADVMYGTTGDDVLCGLGGDDILFGLDGDDRLEGGPGVDVLIGSAGSDALHGGAGDDDLAGNEGDDALRGAGAQDVVLGGDGADILEGELDADVLEGGTGDDLISGGNGSDRAVGDEGTDSLDGGADSDVCLSGEALERLQINVRPPAC